MAGKVGNSQHSHEVSDQLAHSQSAYSALLPIFGSNFSGHGVRNETMRPQAFKFAGESQEGWGMHADGTVDCIDVRRLTSWTFGMSPFSWNLLWHAESDLFERASNDAQAHKALIKRIVVNVVVLYDVVWIPDPYAWAVLITTPTLDFNGASGILVPAPAFYTGAAMLRRDMFVKRRRAPSICRRK